MTRPTRANVPPLSSSSRRRRKEKVLSIHEIEEDLKEDLISIRLFFSRTWFDSSTREKQRSYEEYEMLNRRF